MFRRMAIVPFEIAIAVLVILSGFTGLVHYGIIDPVSALLPDWESASLNWISLLSGFFMALGVASGKGKLELPGLMLLNGAIISRFLLYGHYLGYGSNFVQIGIFDLIIVVASLVRASSIGKKHTIVRLKNGISGYSQDIHS